MKIRFISLASGSSGNCYYLGTEKYGILIDAGIGIRTIKKSLKDINVTMDSIRAVFITHDHADHIKAVGHLGEKLNIPVYTTARVHAGINKSYCMTEKLHGSVRYLEKEEPMQLEDFRIESFEVPHDGTDNVGYCIETANFLAENIMEHLRYIWLCHLSKDNNHPELAYKTVEWKLKSKGIIVGKDVQLLALKRNTPSELYEFE